MPAAGSQIPDSVPGEVLSGSVLVCRAGAISHNGFGGRCAKAANKACGENVAYNRPPQMSETVADTHQRWMDSPGHRANIQNEGFDIVGYGWFVCKSSDRMYWTGFFGKTY